MWGSAHLLTRVAGGRLSMAKHHARKCVYAVFIYISTPIPLSFASDEWAEEQLLSVAMHGGKYGMRVADIRGGHNNPVSIMTKATGWLAGIRFLGAGGGGRYIFLLLSNRLVDLPNLLSSGIGKLRRELSGRSLKVGTHF